MKTRESILSVTRRDFVLGSATFLAAGRGLAKQPRNPAVEEELKRQIAAKQIAGGVCGLVGGPIYAVGDRTRHPTVTPMTPDSLFDLASVGKTFTTSLCAMLVSDGKLELDAPFTKYLPEHVLAKENCAITVRDLAMHIGGFDNSKPYILKEPDAAAFDAALFKKRPVRARGIKYEYACSNFIYLGKIVERLTGLELEAAAKKMLWEPLGMKDTYWHDIPGHPRAVQVFTNNRPAIGMRSDEQARSYPSATGNGATFSSISDMLLFADDLLHRKHFKKAYYDLLFTPCFEKDDSRRSFGWDMSPKIVPNGWSSSTIEHGGHTGITIAVDPVNKYSGIVMTNRTGDWWQGYECRMRLLSLMSGCPVS